MSEEIHLEEEEVGFFSLLKREEERKGADVDLDDVVGLGDCISSVVSAFV